MVRKIFLTLLEKTRWNLFFIVGFTFIASCTKTDKEIPFFKVIEKGMELPVSTIKNISGKKLVLSKQEANFKMLHFWATWCVPCVKELPEIRKFQKRFINKVDIVLINYGESTEDILQYQKKIELPLATYLDSDLVWSEHFSVEGLPTTFLLDPDLKVIAIATGMRKWEDIGKQNQFEDFLEQY